VTLVNSKVDNVAHGQQDPPHIVALRQHGRGSRIRSMGTPQQAVVPEAQKRDEKSKEKLAALEADSPVLTGQCRGCPGAEAVLDRRSGTGIYLLLLGISSRPSARLWICHRIGVGQCGRAPSTKPYVFSSRRWEAPLIEPLDLTGSDANEDDLA
jgi:hypothetical protein